MATTTHRPVLVRYGNFLFRYRNGVFPAVMLATFVLLPPRPLPGDWAADRWLDLAGLAVCLLGQGLRAFVIGLAYIKMARKSASTSPQSLRLLVCRIDNLDHADRTAVDLRDH